MTSPTPTPTDEEKGMSRTLRSLSTGCHMANGQLQRQEFMFETLSIGSYSLNMKKLVLLPNPSVPNKVLTMNRINNKSFYHKYFSWRESPLVANFQFFKIVNISILQSNRRLNLDENKKPKVSVINPASLCLPPHSPPPFFFLTKNLSGTVQVRKQLQEGIVQLRVFHTCCLMIKYLKY